MRTVSRSGRRDDLGSAPIGWPEAKDSRSGFQNSDRTLVSIHMSDTLSKKQLELMDAYWRASNYLTVGQIYLQENPLLREPLRPDHIKPRLLGHWGTSPGLSF